MPSRRPSGSGGGGGLHFREPPDVFATTTARDAYFTDATSGAARLAAFIADRSLVIVIGTLTSPTAYQTYTGGTVYSGAAWANRVDAVRGPQGRMGPAGTVDNLTLAQALTPPITVAGWRAPAIGDTLQTTGTAILTGTQAVYIQFAVADAVRAAIRAGLLGLRIRATFRVRSGGASTTPVVLGAALLDVDDDGAIDNLGNANYPQNSQGVFHGQQVFDLDAGASIATTGNMFVRLTRVSGPTNDTHLDTFALAASTLGGGEDGVVDGVELSEAGGVLTITLERSGGLADLTDTVQLPAGGGGDGISSVSPTDLDGIDTAQLGRIIGVSASDGSEFQQIDPAALSITLEQIRAALSLPALAEANRGQAVVRNADDNTGFSYASITGERNTVHVGILAPDDDTGENGDLWFRYISATQIDAYFKVGGSWTRNASIDQGGTLAGIVAALGMPALAAGNRGQVVIRKNDDTGFTYSDIGDLLRVRPAVTTFDVTGMERVAAGTDLNDETYRYTSRISQTSHVAAARIIGFPVAASAQIPITVSNPAVLVAALPSFDHASGEIPIADMTTLANDGDRYVLRLEVYESGQVVASENPVAYQDYVIEAQATADQTYFIHIPVADDATDVTLAAAQVISQRHGVAGNWVVAGIPAAGEHRLGWVVPTSDLQPRRWTQGGFDISSGVAAAVARQIGSPAVAYQVYLYKAANAVMAATNGQTIVVET